MAVVYAKHSWNGNISVEKDEHVDVVGNDRFRWYTIKKKGTEQKGMVSNAILRNCPDNITDCAVVVEDYEESVYLKFRKSDQLEVKDLNFCKEGWWYAKDKRTLKEGYIHPPYVSCKMGIIGALIM